MAQGGALMGGGVIERKETYDEINNNQSSGNSPWPAAEEEGGQGGWVKGWDGSNYVFLFLLGSGE